MFAENAKNFRFFWCFFKHVFAKNAKNFRFFSESALGVRDNLKNHLYARKRSDGAHMRGVRAFPMLVNKNVLFKVHFEYI